MMLAEEAAQLAGSRLNLAAVQDLNVLKVKEVTPLQLVKLLIRSRPERTKRSVRHSMCR